MATDKLINSTQGDDIIGALNDIADNVGNITYGPQTSSDKVVSMLGYAEAAEAASINPGDTLNKAIGKLEKKANDNAAEIENKIDKLTTATAGDIATVTATGEIADSAVSIADSNTGLADSDTAVPTSKTVKTYVDSTATGISRYLGTITTANQLSTSAKKGDFYVVKTAWTGVHAGDEIIAEKDNPSQTIDGTNWSLLHNEADTDTKYTFATGDTNGTFKVTPSDTGVAQPVAIKGLGNAAYKGVADTVSTSTDLVTSNAVNTKLGDYVQNSDFVVAENNILYTLNRTGKNYLPTTVEASKTVSNVTYTVNSDGSVTVSTTASGASASTSFNYSGGYVKNNYGGLIVSGAPTGSDSGICIYIAYSDDGSSQVGAAARVYEGNPTYQITNDHPYIGIFIIVDSGKKITTAITFKLMISESEMYAKDPSYQPYTLPNFDLTRLEAEDRAGLVDVVDSGAKNFIKCFDTYSITEVTQTSSNGVVSATWTAIGSSNVYCRINEDLTLQPGTYVITGMQESNVAYYLHLEANGSTVANVETTAAAEFTVTNASAVYRLFIGVKANTAAQTSPKIIKPMICTKAAFGVSSKFVPYRPNWDLVSYYAESGGFQNENHGGVINNADVNTINKTTFAVYNNPTNMPNGESGYCWIRTTIYNAESALQELFMFTTGVSYVRVRYNSETTWQPWKQITNA